MADEVELYKKHRPKTLDDLVGQPAVVKKLKDFIKRGEVPHAMLFLGDSGVGKTTTARILQAELNCSDTDFYEINAADFRGIDTVREIRQRISLAPMGGDCRIYLVDEAHGLTSQAADSMLKVLEDTPRHAYFILCTTLPQKIKKTVRTRCEELVFKNLTASDGIKLINSVVEKEEATVSSEVVEAIVKVSDGSARKMLVILHSVIGLGSDEEMLHVISSSDQEAEAIQLARLLMNPKQNFSEIAKLLKGLNEDPESVRWLVLSYARTVLLSGGRNQKQAYLIINSFRDNFFDSKQAGLAAACYEIFQG